ncbi:MAG: DUF2934 domain-containing protein, partial [Candidatus Omnitrophica bacterium]|nr:DUF2934 domain-containing protein [Candidatus Omnitrophota bacterium]
MPKFDAPKRSQTSADLTEKIRKVAYELYEKRGHATGRDMDDWLKAEKLVKSTKR